MRFHLRATRIAGPIVALLLALAVSHVSAADGGGDAARNALPLALKISSTNDDGDVSGTVRGHLDASYARVRELLDEPANWCELITLHLNVKACTHSGSAADATLRVYSGRKYYEPADEAEEMTFSFTTALTEDEVMSVRMRGEAGPLGTEDYRMTARFAPAADGGTDVEFSYAYRMGFRAKLALATYLSTLGAGKIGFTVTGEAEDGDPTYIGGARGMMERNAMRYYLALVAYFEHAPGTSFDPSAAAAHWADLTAQFPDQLSEVPRAEYLDAKTREYAQQRRMQAALDAR